MSLPSDDILTRPLGVPEPADASLKGRLARLRARLRPAHVYAGLAALPTGALAILLIVGDPRGGEPRTHAEIALREAPADQPRPASMEQPRMAEAEPAPPLQRSAEEVESASGVTVFRPSGSAAPSEAVVIRVPTVSVKLAPAPDARLVERGRHGAMPKVGEGRLRPLDLYARPEEPGSGPRIAILLTGLGTGQAATASAIVKLPPQVSLAFSPYGEVERSAARARDFGHEVMVQVPMEPFDYPDSDPGPQTLLTGARPAENADRLAWVMSRVPGAIGLANLMGSKLITDATALEPLLREVAARGLGFVDDGTAQRSLVASLAAKTKAPAARAEIVLDAAPRAEAIDAELARLEAQARAKGFVLASAGAQPLTIERVARWAKDLDARGIRLVPVSAALRTPAAGTRLSRAE
ncbi:divergent polysaccharide deacetylase family protein [Methylobacterium segetis]|uniref:divergent polysaccharide deacetylase family protein n=2 Tax=Methylobacterium segetis TaxID=2488750 RepID=UPI00104954D5|nr:divergent polysaccharide deacetylase family protein [Methylobacterium segetis]